MHISHKIHWWLTMALVFIMPIYQRPMAGLIVLMALNWLWMRVREGWTQFHFRLATAAMVAFYLLHVLGLTWTTNMDAGLFDLEVKLSFAVLPLIFSTSYRMTPRQLRAVIFSFIAGVVVATLICTGQSIYHWLQPGRRQGKWFWFFGKYWVFHMHLGYFAMYINMAMGAIVWYLTYDWKRIRLPRRIFWFGLIAFLATAEFLTTSKNGILTLIVVGVLVLVYVVYKQKRYWLGGISFVALAALCFTIWKASPRVRYRFETAWKVMQETDHDPASIESTAIRSFAWESAGAVFEDNLLLGVGTGDVRAELNAVYAEKGYTGALEKNINAHSMYFQVAVCFGILGLLSMLLMLGTAFWVSLRQRKRLLSLFLLIVMIYMATESLFEVQAGVLFYTLFGSILLYAAERRQFGGSSNTL